VWLLGSSAFSGQLAAQLGLGFSFAAHINKPMAVNVMRAYRAGFQPSHRFASPQAMLAVSVIVAETDERAQELAIIQRVSMFRLLQGAMAPAPTLEEAREIAASIPPQSRMQLDSMQANTFIGTPQQVMGEARDFADACEADEVMVTSFVPFASEREYIIRAVKAAWDEVDAS
jgi:luciferase family oxidoreductase group 1